MKTHFILVSIIVLLFSSGNIISAEKEFMELSDLITDIKICKKVLAGNDKVLVCKYRLGDMVDVEVHRVGLGDAYADINKSDRDGDFYVRYGKAAGCIIITIGRNPSGRINTYTKGKPLRGDAHISLVTGNVFDDYRICEEDGF